MYTATTSVAYCLHTVPDILYAPRGYVCLIPQPFEIKLNLVFSVLTPTAATGQDASNEGKAIIRNHRY